MAYFQVDLSETWRRVRRLARGIGPGLTSGASRNDPSSIGAYAKVGAQMGLGILWVALYSFPLLAGIQYISARVGRVTGKGLAENMRYLYPRWLTFSAIGILAAANVINLGADIGAMAAVLKLLIGGPLLVYSAAFAVISLALQVCLSYAKYVALLKWLTLALAAYVATAFAVHIPWSKAMQRTVVPVLSLTPAGITAIVAALGATINPYLFFWQASQEVEDQEGTPGQKPLREAPRQAERQITKVAFDTTLSMTLSNVVAFFIMLTTAVTLHANGIGDIANASEAASALEPVTGKFSSLVFSLGIIGAGMLAVPVLAGSAAYAVGEALGWPVSLDCKPREAKGFYAVLMAAGAIGFALNLIGLNPMKALYWTAILNGIVVGPLMLVVMRMATSRRVMGQFVISRPVRVLGWIATAVMVAAAIAMFVVTL